MADKHEILQAIQELTTTVKEHKEDQATIDIDALGEQLQGMVDSAVKDAQAEAEAKRPVRKGELVGPEGFEEPTLGIVEEGKFAGKKVADVIWAGNMLRKLRANPSNNNIEPESRAMTKLLHSTTTDAGDEWVPTGMAAEIWADAFLASRVVSNLNPFTMPTDPFDVPGWAEVTFRKATAGEASDAQNPETHKSTLTSTEHIAEINWSYSLDEDSIVAVMPQTRAELARGAAEYMDSFALNADSTSAATGNINLNDATPPTDSYYLSDGQDGIRHYYLVDATGQSTDITSTLEDAEWLAGVARLGKYGAAGRPDLVAFTNVKTYLLSILGLTNVRTVDKYGGMATIVSGELASMDGIPIVVATGMPLAGDDGFVVATAASNDEGQIAIVHRPSWRVGFKRNLMIEMDKDIRRRTYIMVCTYRMALGCRDNGKASARADGHTAGIHGIAYS